MATPVNEILVLGVDPRMADEAINELLRKYSDDYRRRDSVWEATLTEAELNKMLAELDKRKEVVVAGADAESKILAQLSQKSWARNAAPAESGGRPQAGKRKQSRSKDKGGAPLAKLDDAIKKVGKELEVDRPAPEGKAPGGFGGGAAPEPEEDREFAKRRGRRSGKSKPANKALGDTRDEETDSDSDEKQGPARRIRFYIFTVEDVPALEKLRRSK
jgi:hypothetical protein